MGSDSVFLVRVVGGHLHVFWGKVSLSAKGVALNFDRLVVSNSTNYFC